MIKACQYCEYSYEHKQKYTGVNVPNEEEFSWRRFPQEIPKFRTDWCGEFMVAGKQNV